MRRPLGAAGAAATAAVAADGSRFAPGRRRGSPAVVLPAVSGVAAARAFVATQRWSPSEAHRLPGLPDSGPEAPDPAAAAPVVTRGPAESRRSMTRAGSPGPEPAVASSENHTEIESKIGVGARSPAAGADPIVGAPGSGARNRTDDDAAA